MAYLLPKRYNMVHKQMGSCKIVTKNIIYQKRININCAEVKQNHRSLDSRHHAKLDTVNSIGSLVISYWAAR